MLVCTSSPWISRAFVAFRWEINTTCIDWVHHSTEWIVRLPFLQIHKTQQTKSIIQTAVEIFSPNPGNLQCFLLSSSLWWNKQKKNKHKICNLKETEITQNNTQPFRIWRKNCRWEQASTWTRASQKVLYLH